MLEVNLREDNNPLFIGGSLKQIQDQRTVCTLWQNIGGKRLITKGMITDLSFTGQIISLSPLGGEFFFVKEEPIYFQSEHRHVLFKTKISFINKTNLLIKIPRNIRAIEAREEIRYSVLNDKNPLDFLFFKYKAYDANPVDYVYRGCDVSNGGGSFLITTGSLPKFHVKDTIHFKGFGQEEYKPPMEATITNISQYHNPKYQNFGHHRVGFQWKVRINAANLRCVKSLFF